MPYASKAQQRFAHTDTAKRKGFPTKEFDSATKDYSKLPARVGKPKSLSSKSMRGRR